MKQIDVARALTNSIANYQPKEISANSTLLIFFVKPETAKPRQDLKLGKID